MGRYRDEAVYCEANGGDEAGCSHLHRCLSLGAFDGVEVRGLDGHTKPNAPRKEDYNESDSSCKQVS